MAALPYIQLYVADYLADTMHLSTEEHGAYLLIIFNYWQTGKAVQKARLSSVAKVTPGRWKEMEPVLGEFFREKEGAWHHFRIDCDLSKVKSKSIKASRAGKKSAQKRAFQAAEKKEESNERSTDVPTDVIETLQQKPNHTEADTNTDTNTEIKKAFVLPIGVNQEAWAEFEEHRRTIKKSLTDLARTKASNILLKLSLEDQQACVDKSIQSRWPGLYPEKSVKVNGHKPGDATREQELAAWMGGTDHIEGEFTRD